MRIALVSILLLALYSFPPDGPTVNHRSRIALTRAIAEAGTFKIDNFREGTIDWAEYEGHFYTNKAPGASFLGVPVWWTLVQIEKAMGKNPDVLFEENLGITSSFVSALPSVILFWVLFACAPTWLALAYAIGTIAWPFSTQLWGSQTAAVFLFIAFDALTRRKAFAWAGFLFAMAVLTEYSCAIAAPAFLFLLIRGGAKKEDLARFFAAALPVAVLFLGYHLVCFGSPFALAPKYQNPELEHHANALFGVINLPHPKVLWELLFGFKRGLLMISPFLFFAFAGFMQWLKTSRNQALASLWIVGVFFLFNSSYDGWHGGWSSGPRYLLPMIPFMALSLSQIRINRFVAALTAISVLNCLVITSVTMRAKPEYNLFLETYPHVFESAHLAGFAMRLLGILLLVIIVRPLRS